ncbi:MAG: ABC exporter membrane fusion protein [Cyanobacteria bacterium J06638_38]
MLYSEQRLEAKQNLIAALLTYPNKAGQILNRNLDLLDARLLQMMEQEAVGMGANGSTEAADFLQNLAAQLREAVTNAVAMINPQKNNNSFNEVDQVALPDANPKLYSVVKTEAVVEDLDVKESDIAKDLEPDLDPDSNPNSDPKNFNSSLPPPISVLPSPKKQRFPSRLAVAMLVSGALATAAVATHSVLEQQPTSPSPNPSLPESEVELNAVAALGYLEPQGEVLEISAPSASEGGRIKQLFVKQGEQIKTGQVIAVLDNRDRLEAALKEAQTKVQAAQARLAQVKAGAKAGTINAQKARIQNLEAELQGQILTGEATIANLNAELKGEKSAQQATIQRLKAESDNAQTECGRSEMLYREGAISASDRDSTCLRQRTAEERLKEVQATMNRTVTTRQEQIREATANLNRMVETLRKQIKEAEATLDEISEVRSVDVQVTTAELATAKAAVQQAQTSLDLAYVRSPIDGQILKINTWAGEIVNDQGIVEIGQTDQMYVTAEVYETDISKVRIGQPVTITSDGVIGDLQGTVDKIGLQIGKKDVLGTDPTADTDARVVEVKIRLEPQDSQQVAGLTNLRVKAIINTDSSQANATN